MLVIGNSSVLSILTDSAEAAVIKVKNTGLADITPVIDISVQELNGTDIPITTAFTYTSIVPSAGGTSLPGAVLRWEPGLMIQDQEETLDLDLTIVDISLFAHQFRVVATNTTADDVPGNDIGYRTFDILKCSDLTECDLQYILTKSYTFDSPSGASGAFYVAGFYESEDADANLDEGSTTVVMGSADNSYAAHAFIVAGGIGTATGGSGAVTITVTGTSILDDGTRQETDSETLVADITTLATDDYLSTTKKWLGQITFTLDVGATGHTAYAADFNYGLAKYEDFGNRDYTIEAFEIVGLANASDTGFNIEWCHHTAIGWTYAATGFVPGVLSLWTLATDHGTEDNLVTDKHFAWKRTGLSQLIDGSAEDGILIRVTTTANNAIDFMNIHLSVSIAI